MFQKKIDVLKYKDVFNFLGNFYFIKNCVTNHI